MATEAPPNAAHMSERQEYRWMLYNGTPAARVKALETLFIKFDINGSGEIDYDEFKKILWWLEFSLSDEGVREIFDELDADRSNCLDMREFVRFFDVLDRYRQMHEADVKDQQVGLVRSKICQMFFVIIILATAFFAYSWVAASAQGRDASKWLTMTLVGASMLFVGIFVLAAYPILMMKYEKYQQEREQRNFELQQMKANMAHHETMDSPKSGKGSKSPMGMGSTSRSRPQLDSDGFADFGDEPRFQSSTMTPGGGQQMMSSYRMSRMDQSQMQLMDQSMHSTMGASQTMSPNNQSQQHNMGGSPNNQSKYALQDFSKQASQILSDEELIAEYQNNEEIEDFAYHQGNYDLAKIQQHQITPSTFHPMATKGYRGSWVQKNNPNLTLQGTSDYVGKSIQNTNRMSQHAQREGLTKQKIENIKLNSTISSGWYGGSCSPYESSHMIPPQATNNRIAPTEPGGLIGGTAPRGHGQGALMNTGMSSSPKKIGTHGNSPKSQLALGN
ncbi:unnamed protein product [Amoebophrya sp. A120]|nr:unnamed protein product [Amoebophrya sp. A120]|eukprot:GSA120T00013993001.1